MKFGLLLNMAILSSTYFVEAKASDDILMNHQHLSLPSRTRQQEDQDDGTEKSETEVQTDKKSAGKHTEPKRAQEEDDGIHVDDKAELPETQGIPGIAPLPIPIETIELPAKEAQISRLEDESKAVELSEAKKKSPPDDDKKALEKTEKKHSWFRQKPKADPEKAETFDKPTRDFNVRLTREAGGALKLLLEQEVTTTKMYVCPIEVPYAEEVVQHFDKDKTDGVLDFGHVVVIEKRVNRGYGKGVGFQLLEKSRDLRQVMLLYGATVSLACAGKKDPPGKDGKDADSGHIVCGFHCGNASIPGCEPI